MKPSLFLLLFICLFSCKKENIVTDKIAINDSLKHVTEEKVTEQAIEESDFDFMNETLDGWLKIGASEKMIKEKAGADYTVTVIGESQVTGAYEEEWTFKTQELQLVMESDNAESEKTIAQITLTSASKLKTLKGIGIGSSKNEILAAYNGQISKEATDNNTIIVGSIYGGLFFTIKDNKVSEIFIGAIAE